MSSPGLAVLSGKRKAPRRGFAWTKDRHGSSRAIADLRESLPHVSLPAPPAAPRLPGARATLERPFYSSSQRLMCFNVAHERDEATEYRSFRPTRSTSCAVPAAIPIPPSARPPPAPYPPPALGPPGPGTNARTLSTPDGVSGVLCFGVSAFADGVVFRCFCVSAQLSVSVFLCFCVRPPAGEKNRRYLMKSSKICAKCCASRRPAAASHPRRRPAHCSTARVYTWFGVFLA